MNIRIDAKKLFNNILFLCGILFLAQASKLLELGANQDQFDDITDSLDITDNDHSMDAFINIEDSIDIIDIDQPIHTFMNIEDSIDIIDDVFADAFMDIEKAIDIRDNDVKDAECRNRFLKIIDSIHVEGEYENFDNNKKTAKKQGFLHDSKDIRKLCFSFLCRTDVSAAYLAFGKNFQEEFWTLFKNEWDHLRRKKALATYEKNLCGKEIVGPILGGLAIGFTTRITVTIQNLLKEYPNISSWVRRFPLSARFKVGDEFYLYHFDRYDKKNSELSFTDKFGLRLILNLENVSLRALVMDEEMPHTVVARKYNPDRQSSPRVEEIRFVFVSIEKIKKMIQSNSD